MAEQAKIVSTLPGREDGEVAATFIDRCEVHPVRHGRNWDFACSVHRYAMENPDRELVLLVGNHSRRRLFWDEVVAAARDAKVAVTTSSNLLSVKWPNNTRLRIEGSDTRGIL